MLNGLDLFSGIGGITVALSGWVQPIAYCENDPYCRGVLLSRMAEGSIAAAPIWDDVRTFDGRHLRGAVDVIYGGFPCQDISVAGNGAGLGGKRSGLFFEVLRLVEEIRPRYIFLENVPAIRTRGLERVVKELSALWYDCRWGMLSAFDVGAPHKRERWFLLAADTKRFKLWDKQGRSGWTSRQSSTESPDHGEKTWRTPKPEFCRVDDGLPGELVRLRALGNAVVPAQAREAFKRLMGL